MAAASRGSRGGSRGGFKGFEWVEGRTVAAGRRRFEETRGGWRADRERFLVFWGLGFLEFRVFLVCRVLNFGVFEF